MHTVVAVLLGSLLWLCPVMVEAGTAGTGAQCPEQPQFMSKDSLKLLQEHLPVEGVYAGPISGELNA